MAATALCEYFGVDLTTLGLMTNPFRGKWAPGGRRTGPAPLQVLQILDNTCVRRRSGAWQRCMPSPRARRPEGLTAPALRVELRRRGGSAKATEPAKVDPVLRRLQTQGLLAKRELRQEVRWYAKR